MDEEISGLESRVAALIQYAGEMRAANVALRQQLASLQHEHRQLSDRMQTASARIEALLRKLPATAE